MTETSGNEMPADRRYSTRLLSQSVAQTLRQLKKDEHEFRVLELIKKNKRFYHRQAVCEIVFMLSAITSFTGTGSVVVAVYYLPDLVCRLS